MKYQVIARRYRPRRLEEVVGQEPVAATLRNAILQDRLAHAYLFAGPRGVGKTSMARIFAKALNCPQASDRSRPREEWGLACDACDVCRAVQAGDDIDVLEVDGASYRGIEDVRDIVENVQFTTSRSPYKIFIIDEVHMLTREAFNALLKTLEEPPAHVKFIFATTEAHKIPETVLSRCQRFDFRPILEEDIVKRLEQICRQEGVTPEPGLLWKIARYGKGGLRDAQSLLDQAITFSSGDTLRSADLERITGRLPDAAIERVLAAIEARDPPAAFRAVGECFAAGADPAILVDQVIERLRDRLGECLPPASRQGALPLREGVEATAPGRAEDGPRPDLPQLDLSLGRLQVLHETALRLRGSPYPRLAVELALVKLARMEDPRALDEALAYLKKIEGRLEPGSSPSGNAREGMPPPGGASQPAPAVRTSTTGDGHGGHPASEEPRPAVPAEALRLEDPGVPVARPGPPGSPAAPGDFDFARLVSLWGQILIESRERFPKTAAFLSRARLREGQDRGTFLVALESEFHQKQLREPRRAREFERLVAEVTGAPWRMGLEVGPPAGSGGLPGLGPPVRGADGQALKDDPLVKKSLELFKGKIVGAVLEPRPGQERARGEKT